MVMSAVLVVVVALVVIMPLVAHAMFYGHGGGVPTRHPKSGSGNTGNTGNSNNGSTSKQTIKHSKTVTFTNTTTTVTITKTYTQVVTQTYVINHYIYEYMYPIIQWIFTLVNIGQYQQPGYHNVGNTKTFLPGFGGGNGIFVPVFAQEAIYIFNIAPSTKPQITGWYTGSTSQSSSGPYLVSQSSTPPQLTGIQDTVNTIQQQASYTVPNITKTTTYWNYNTQPQYITGQTPNPYYYSKQGILGAYATGDLYAVTAALDLQHGNIAGATQATSQALYYYAKGFYEQVWNLYTGAVSTLYQTTLNPNNPWSVAHLLSIGNVINAADTVLSAWKSAINNGWNQAMGWFGWL